MCKPISSPTILPGWGCCRCHLYNGAQRATCKACGKPPCVPIDRKKLAEQANAECGRQIFVVDGTEIRVA